MTKGKMMSDLKTRLKMPLFRRSSATSTTASAKSQSAASSIHSIVGNPRSNRSKTSLLTTSRKGVNQSETVQEEDFAETSSQQTPQQLHPQELAELPTPPIQNIPGTFSTEQTQSTAIVDPGVPTPEPSPLSPVGPHEVDASYQHNPQLVLQEATPIPSSSQQSPNPPDQDLSSLRGEVARAPLPRRQSLADNSEQKFIKNLLQGHNTTQVEPVESVDYFTGALPTLSAAMLHRKIWVKRPGASATLVQINEEDLVDDVRDMILKKYANSLGRSFDSPDVTLRIVPRETHSHRSTHGERTLGPEEPITRTLDAYYPGGQTVEEALLIDVPVRRTPRSSPRVQLPYYYQESARPQETDQGYFPAIPIAQHSPQPQSNVSVAGSVGSREHQHSIAVLNTGQIPPLPSPGGRRRRQHEEHRPKFPRNATSSPTTLTGQPPHNDTRVHASAAPNPPPLPTPPLATMAPPQTVATPPPRVSSPRPATKKRPAKKAKEPNLPGSLLDGAVPPINVLIVEDNNINLRLLEAFMKRLKVRWSTAINGREAVNKWREGGFHLVLMDIQLPIMNGLDATKEIRRIESANGVGVFAMKTPTEESSKDSAALEKDKLNNTELFKSPVIIVALTASSLQSDRHDALAAGCNDFLTKPVNFVWLERKVMEWGCMQALIDFDGWRKWKDLSATQQAAAAQKLAEKQALAASKKASASKSASTTTLTSTTTTGTSTKPLSPNNEIPPQKALSKLSTQADSANTVSTIDSLESTSTTSSSETAAPPDPAANSAAPSTFAPPSLPGQNSSSGGSSTTITQSQSTPAPITTAKSPSPTTNSHRPSPLHASTSMSPKSPGKGEGRGVSRSPKDERRRKRGSMGGLTGVVEEFEENGSPGKERRAVVGA